MNLADLGGQFYRLHVLRDSVMDRDVVTHQRVDRLEDAQGVAFLCPKCYIEKGGPVGVHGVICWFAERGVPDWATPGPGRWTPSGSGMHDLTLTPSVLIGGCEWHGVVESGDAA